MLTVDGRWLQIAEQSGAAPVFVVNIDGGALKIAKAARNIFGYPANVLRIVGRGSSVDLRTLRQTVSSLSLEVVDDGLVRDLIASDDFIGKDIVVTQGYDVGLIGAGTDMPEAAFVTFHTGTIIGHRQRNGIITVTTMDPRASVFNRSGSKLPKTGVDEAGTSYAVAQGYMIHGAATEAVRELYRDAGIPASKFAASTFEPASHPSSGHLVVDRRVFPEPGTYNGDTGQGGHPEALRSDRRVLEPTAVDQLVDEVLNVTRALVLVQEDGLISLKENDLAEAAVGRFTENDIVAGTYECGLNDEAIITSVQVKTGYEGLSSAGGPTFRVHFRDDDDDGKIEWGYQDGTERDADFSIEDRWFSTPVIRDPRAPNILVGDTTITGIVRENTMFTGAFHTLIAGVGAGLSVDASRPAYFWIWGPDPTKSAYEEQPGEIIKCTSVVRNADKSYTLSGISRGQFGTTARQHGNISGGPVVKTTSDVVMWDITALIRATDHVLKSFAEGAQRVRFSTPYNHCFRFQLGDVVHHEHPLFLARGVNGLAVGNTERFRIVGKNVNPEGMVIDWELQWVRNKSRSNSIVDRHGGVLDDYHGPMAGLGGSIPDAWTTVGPGGDATAGELPNYFMSGAVPVAVSGLQVKIPRQVIASPLGKIRTGDVAITLSDDQDHYIDFVPRPLGLHSWRDTPVANGAAAPAIADGEMRAFKIVASGGAIGTITDLRATSAVDGTRNIKDETIIDRLIDPTRSLVAVDAVDPSTKNVDLARAGVVGKNLDNVANSATRKAVSEIDANDRALVDLAEAHVNTLPKAKVNATGTWTEAEIPVLTNAKYPDALLADGSRVASKIVLDDVDATPVADRQIRVHDGLIRAEDTTGTEVPAIRGSSLKEGTGPLQHLSSAGLLDFGAAHPSKGELATLNKADVTSHIGGADVATIPIDTKTTGNIPVARVPEAQTITGQGALATRNTALASHIERGVVHGRHLNAGRVVFGDYPSLTFTAPVADVSDGEIGWGAFDVWEDGNSFDFGANSVAGARYIWIDLDVSTSVVQSGNTAPAPAPRRLVIAAANSGMGMSEDDLATALQEFRVVGALHAQEISPATGDARFGIPARGVTVGKDGIIAAGTDADIPVKLESQGVSPAKIGRRGTLLSIAGAGTSFPSSPSTGEVFFRTDRGTLYYYTGTTWKPIGADGWTRFSARKTNTQTVGTGATTVVYNTEDYDPSGSFNPSNGVYTVPETGTYLFTANVHFQSVPDLVWVLGYIAVGGSHAGGGTRATGNGSTLEINMTLMHEIAAGATVRVDVQTEGAARTADGTGVGMRFSGVRIA